MNSRIRKMILAAMMLALCMLLPYLTGQIPSIGRALSPMHIPVFLGGFLCGMPWAPIVGFIAPLLRSVLLGMPSLFPSAVAMAFELAAYGAVVALLNRRLPRRPACVYLALIAAMLAGRAVWGAVSFALYGLSGSAFTFSMFLAGAFTNTIPGIICHIAIIPPIIFALRRSSLLKD